MQLDVFFNRYGGCCSYFAGRRVVFLNRYGDHYWLLDVDMDCTKTGENGYFEVKGYSTSRGWEVDVPSHVCSGPGSYPLPAYTSINQFARCGYINVFKADGSCEINSLTSQDLPDDPILG